MNRSFKKIACISLLLLGGCATQLERSNDQELRRISQTRASIPNTKHNLEQESPGSIKPNGTLEHYIRYALDHNPSLRSSFEQWRASAQRIPQARRLPEPVITYGYFVRRVETRVGPQRQRIGISQSFPWPTKLTAGADSASLAARSAQRRYEAAALELTRKIAEAYWRLWLIERTQTLQNEQKLLLEHFSAVVRGRVEVGQATLSDLGQIDLQVSRIVDEISSLDEQKYVASAMLVAAMGAPTGTTTPITTEPPSLIETTESESSLLSSVIDHPGVRAYGLLAEAQQHRARALGAEAYPSFTVGVDYIETGPAVMPDVADSGKDAIVAMVGAKVPLWSGLYRAGENEAYAESAAHRAQEAAARDQAVAELQKALSLVRDTARRAKLHRNTLLPQAQTVYTSSLGSYQVGRATLASVIMAQRDLIEIHLGLDRALADHALAWARLEEVVGRPIKSRSAQ